MMNRYMITTNAAPSTNPILNPGPPHADVACSAVFNPHKMSAVTAMHAN